MADDHKRIVNSGFPSSSTLYSLLAPLDATSLIRKRKRSDSDEVEGDLVSVPLSSACSTAAMSMDETNIPGPSAIDLRGQAGAQRDISYYFEDGSCILLVEDTLFNVGEPFILGTIA